MKRILLALSFLIGSIAGASAACTSPAVMKDFPGTSFNMSLATNAGDGNCSSNMTIVGTLPAYTSVPAFKIDQTTPGTTNLVAAGQNGTWNITNISGTVSLPTGAATSANQTTANTSLATIATNSALALPAQSGIGNVNIGAVEAFAPIQNTIAASQTAQVMSATQGGGTGAAGDYLSHCIIQPGTTSPGSFQILNNATVIYNFPGGASSVSNLVSWAVPIGSVSAGGGWKITNTTNITGTCFGKFS